MKNKMKLYMTNNEKKKRENNHFIFNLFLSKGHNQEAPPILQKPANHSAGWYLMSFIISVYC